MSDADNFLGLVAMVKSLRRQGHDEPVTVLDLGLSAAQRDLLQNDVDLVRLPDVDRRHPFFLAPYPFLLDAAGTVVIIDADVIVTQTLEPVLTAAARGMLCAAPDLVPDRWFAEWQSIFGLERAPRRGVYVNAGFVAFSTDHLPDLLRRWWECCDGLAASHSWPLPAADPVGYLDQDALDAILMSEVPEARLRLLPEDWAIQGSDRLARTTVVDRRRLACRFEGRPTVLLHAVRPGKPWQPAAQRDLRRTAYLICLRELLVGHDAPAVPRAMAPAWLRPGVVSAATMRALFAMRSMRRGKARAGRVLRSIKRQLPVKRGSRSSATAARISAKSSLRLMNVW
jgi:hypothetical protein